MYNTRSLYTMYELPEAPDIIHVAPSRCPGMLVWCVMWSRRDSTTTSKTSLSSSASPPSGQLAERIIIAAAAAVFATCLQYWHTKSHTITNAYIHIHTHVRMHTHTHTHTHTHKHTHTHTHKHASYTLKMTPTAYTHTHFMRCIKGPWKLNRWESAKMHNTQSVPSTRTQSAASSPLMHGWSCDYQYSIEVGCGSMAAWYDARYTCYFLSEL